MDSPTSLLLTDLDAEAAPEAMVSTQPLTSSGPWEKRRKVLFRIGLAEVVMGVLSTALGISAVIVAANAGSSWSCQFSRRKTYWSEGIWCGLILATTGALGVGVRKKPSRGLHVANMTMAIISSVALGLGVYFSVFGGLSTAIWCSKALVGLHACVAIICFPSMMITIVHATYCCGGICCLCSYDVVLPYATRGQQQIARVTQHQYVYGPNGRNMILASAPHAPNASRQQQKKMSTTKEGVLVEGLL